MPQHSRFPEEDFLRGAGQVYQKCSVERPVSLIRRYLVVRQIDVGMEWPKTLQLEKMENYYLFKKD